MNKKIICVLTLSTLMLTACNNKSNMVIELPGNATTGYTWSCESKNEDVLELKDSSYQEDDNEEEMVGVGGTSIFTFKGLSKGETSVECIYARSWEEENLYEITYNISVDENNNVTLKSSTGNTGEDFIVPTPSFK